MDYRQRSWTGLLAFGWGVLGVLVLLGQAVVRLAPQASEAFSMELGVTHWVLLAAWLPFMAYAEGWRGFHQRFSPRVVARAVKLAAKPTALRLLLAPAYCMSLLDAPRRRMIVSWTLVIGIVGLVLVVRQLGQPWRGLIDAGVVVGLGIGAASIAYHALRALRGEPPAVAV